MMRRPLIAANWKQYKTALEVHEYVRALARELPKGPVAAEIVLAPPFTLLQTTADAVHAEFSSDTVYVRVAAQDTHFEDRGAFTGEVGPLQILDTGTTWCIVGHSERRQYFGETDERVAKKVRALARHRLNAIVCVGETLTEREQGKTLEIVLAQIHAALEGSWTQEELATVTIAYEPVWAIGTGKNATPADAQEVHVAIRQTLAERIGPSFAGSLRILYGGSVKPENARSLFTQPDIDGGLVGGASLEPAAFAAIVVAAQAKAFAA